MDEQILDVRQEPIYNSLVVTEWSPEDLPNEMDDRDEWRERERERESQGNPCSRHDILIMIIMMINVRSTWKCSNVCEQMTFDLFKILPTNYLFTNHKSWRQHPTKLQLYGHLPPITKTMQVRRTRHAGHYWISRDELISDVLLWTPTNSRVRAGRPDIIYIQQLCEDTGCSPEDLPEAMNDREKWRERVRDIRASGTTWWWWWWYI